MYMYEVILNIIDQKGPASIPSICQEVNQHPTFMQERDQPVQPSQIKSVISRKKDLFSVNNDVVSLLPEKDIMELSVQMSYFKGPWVKLKVDFVKKDFIFFEWNLEPAKIGEYDQVQAGSTDDLKQAIYHLKIWEWNPNYNQNGIILEGINWSTCLTTKARVYKSEGLQKFPKEWSKFCRELTNLTGKRFP
jgi:hypothetical protein